MARNAVRKKRKSLGIPLSGGSLLPVELLGTAPDPVIASQFGISSARVFQLRKRNGIPKFTRPPLPEELLELLGKVSDQELAERFGLLKSTVEIARRRRGIAAVSGRRGFKRRQPKGGWTAEQFALLGTDKDAVVARILGLPVEKVTAKRRSLRILAYRLPRVCPAEWLSLLGRMSDQEITRAFGVPSYQVAKKRRELGIPRWQPLRFKPTESEAALIGRVPDVALAEKLNISRSTARNLRMELGLPRARLSHNWTDQEVQLLGTMSDAEVARRLGLSKAVVRLERLGRRIPGVDPAKWGKSWSSLTKRAGL